MPEVAGLRSPHDQTGGIVYFPRMISKIRLHARGELPKEYVDFLGDVKGMFDWRCTTFLGISYDRIVERTLAGGSEEEILEWAFENGRRPTEQEIEIWNGFMTKRGWNDEASGRLKFRCDEAGFGPERKIETMFQFIDADEGR
ncbi:MAG TPA: DUF5069 domain-containing protein [Luteolibacter sp.]|nr:DUF5069 domain-containing protein [Luteolibacter sp.]